MVCSKKRRPWGAESVRVGGWAPCPPNGEINPLAQAGHLDDPSVSLKSRVNDHANAAFLTSKGRSGTFQH